MSVARGWLMAQWWCARVGLVRAGTMLLCAAAVSIGGILVPYWHMQAKVDRRDLTLARQRLLLPAQSDAIVKTPAPDHLADFYDALGDNRHAEQQLKTLFDLAQKNNLRLSMAEYKSGSHKNSRVQVRQITLPVKATYPAMRLFIEQVLLAIPFASLDELRFKRDSIGSPILETHLQFSLYLLETPATDAMHTAHRAPAR